ncbi:MAG: hypothetical protein EOO77_19390, partial [Oxalobacteraceae bacterium]
MLVTPSTDDRPATNDAQGDRHLPWDPTMERQLWDENWHLLCHRSEVAQPSDYLRFEIFGDEVVAFHDGEQVIVFDNRCPHRGARIFDGTCGKRRWVCPY